MIKQKYYIIIPERFNTTELKIAYLDGFNDGLDKLDSMIEEKR